MNGENIKRNWVKRRVQRGVKFAMFGLVAITVFGFLVRSLWNWLMPPLFGLHALTFWQALGLLVLSWILFGGLRGGPGRYRHRRFRERWEEMTPEQREKARAGMCGHGRDLGAPLAEQKD
jgi:Ca2+/H+ antiporter, TMEM165/GDT1 family